jgi:methylglyoxal synthase
MSTTGQMHEISNVSRELTDEFLRTQAYAGYRLLGRESFEYRRTQEEMKLVLEGQRIPSSTYLLTSRKRIALVAHDNQKMKLASWASRQKARLIEHDLYATSHTADVIAATLNTPVSRLLSGPLGGDQQIGCRIAESRIDVLVFFWDPFGVQPRDCDVKALLRLAAAYNIPNACNEATADCIISALTTE